MGKSVALPFLSAGAGALAALVAGLVVDAADMVLESTLKVRGLSWEMGLFIVPIAASLGGLLAGFFGALVGSRWIGGTVGAIGLGVAGLWLFGLGAGPMPTGTRIGCVVAGIVSGFAAGFVGGGLMERYDRRPAHPPGTGAGRTDA